MGLVGVGGGWWGLVGVGGLVVLSGVGGVKWGLWWVHNPLLTASKTSRNTRRTARWAVR